MACWEYKTVKLAAGGWFGGKVDDKGLEEVLNRFASDGWRLMSMFTSSSDSGVNAG